MPSLVSACIDFAVKYNTVKTAVQNEILEIIIIISVGLFTEFRFTAGVIKYVCEIHNFSGPF